MGAVFNPKPEVRIDSVRGVVGLVRKLASKLGGFAGSTSTASDPTCDHLAGLDKVPPLVVGKVIRSGIGSYDCEVEISGGQTVVCSSLSPVMHDLYGVSQACMPIPGSFVLVYVQSIGLAQSRASRGVILGVLPDNRAGGVSADGSSKIKKLIDSECTEGGVSQVTEGGPAAIASDRSYLYKGEFQLGRPHDLVPGEYGLLNHAGAGMVIGALSTTVKGSEAASVRCSALDDQVRVVSGHFRHINAAGSEEIFNDGGYITVESTVSMYQPERLGVKTFGKKAFEWGSGSLKTLKEVKSSVTQLKPSQTSKKRFYRYAGYLGDIVNVFVANPDPDKDTEDMESKSKDQGLLHYHVDASGRFSMRSAAGILLERYDRIPVPKRHHYAWDPNGDKGEVSSAETKKGYKIPPAYPMGIGVTLGDMSAWYNYLSYARFRQFGKDFTVPDQKDLSCPDDTYDTLGKAEEDYASNDTRHSYIGLTPDGGIVLRDAWGSEIVMADGRITLNAAANIEVRSGSSVVILGGDDVVAKGYNSVDISATKKDVRVKAENNLQLVSMKRGVLIQSKSESNAKPTWSKVGEDLESTGVIIKADKSAVAIMGKQTEMQGLTGVNLAAFGENGKPSGNVVIAGKQVSAVASDNVILTAEGTSGLIVSGQSALLCAPSVLAVGGQSAADISGNKMMLGIPVDVGSMYSQLISICKSQVQLYLDAIDWLNPMPPTVFSEIDFRFRTTKQYGTDKDSGIKGGTFSVYQPSWSVLSDGGRKWMQNCRSRTWDEGKDSADGYPWPGKEAMSGQSYVTFKEKNIDGNGLEKVSSGEAVLTPTGFSSYHIRDRQ